MGEKTNIQWLEKAIHHINRLNKIVREYDRGTMLMADGTSTSITAEKIGELKAAGAMERAACIEALQAISA